MSFLTHTIILNIICALVLSMIFIIIYNVERNTYLKYFAFGNLAYLGTSLLALINERINNNTWYLLFVLLSHLFILLNIIFYLIAGAKFINKSYSKKWFIVFTCSFLWTTLAVLLKWPPILQNITTYSLAAIICIHLGITFIRFLDRNTTASMFLGITFMIWGLHDFSYPLLKQIPDTAPISYILSSIFQPIIAMCIIYLNLYMNKTLLKEGEKKYKLILNTTNDAIILMDNNVFIECNNKTIKILNTTIDNIIGKTITDFSPVLQPCGNKSKDKISEQIEKSNNGENNFFEWTYLNMDGTNIHTEMSLSIINIKNNTYHLLTIRDITLKKEAENFEKMASQVFNRAIEGMTITDDTGKILYVNKAFTTITGFSFNEAISGNPRLLKSNHHNQQFYKNMWSSLLTIGEWSGEVWNRRKNGEAFPVWLDITAIKDAYGKTIRYIGMFHDLTDIKKSKEQIEYQKYYDGLTSLPNRDLFLDRLNIAIKHYLSEQECFAVMAVDINNFKAINDSYGHVFGDDVLMTFTKELTSILDDDITVSRLGGDEFIILLTHLIGDTQTKHYVNKILEHFEKPITIYDQELYLTVSIGITYCSDDILKADTIIKNADIALNKAKTLGRNNYQFYTVSMNKHVHEQLELENKFRKALENQQFIVYYQPKINIQNNKIIGMEALVRWNDPDSGIISPVKFIPLAEETGLIVPLGEYVLKQACIDTQSWISEGYENLTVAVNLSAVQFVNSDLIDLVKQTIIETGLSAKNLELEITESVFINTNNEIISKLNELKDLGVSISLDDFGTGYSSLSYLRKLPLDILKIDRSFVNEIPTDKNAVATISAIITLGHSLNLSITAEGVENKSQIDFLQSYNCDNVQGYYYSPPVSKDDFKKQLEKMY